MQEYDLKNIKETYYTITILDSCDDEYDEIPRRNCPQTLKEACLRVVEMIQHDRELGTDYGVWSYLVVKHEVDDDTDWISTYKVYKYRKQWRYKRVD